MLAEVRRILRTDKRSIGSVALAVRRKWPFQQFRQSYDTKSNNGATGCTDTCIQFLTLIVKGIWYTHDRLRAKVGHRNPYSGLTYGEVSALATSLGLGYRVELGLSWSSIVSLVRLRGPVMIGEMYGWHPSWRGYRYAGRTASVYPNGYAVPLGAAGRTQLGPDFRHAVVIIAIGVRNGVTGAYIMEPNHASPARPEAPPYDFISLAQLRKLIERYGLVNGRSYALVPTRVIKYTGT